MKRLYKQAAVLPAESGFAVMLDGKTVRTPAKAGLVVKSRALADAIAAEWQAQGDKVDPDTMPLTRLASTAIDLVTPRHGEIVAMVAKYQARSRCARISGIRRTSGGIGKKELSMKLTAAIAQTAYGVDASEIVQS